MTPYELLDLALSLSNRLDTHWSLFITVHLALIGGIIYVDRPLTRKEKIVAIVIYCGFAAINNLMMQSQAQFLWSIYHQIDAIKNESCCNGNHVISHIVNLYESNAITTQKYGINAVHLAMFIIISLSIFYDKPVSALTDEKEILAKDKA